MSVLEAPIGPSPKIADTKLYDTQPVARQKFDGPDARLILRVGDFRQHHGFDTRWNVPGCTPSSVVMVSICEVGLIGGHVVPFQGAASMEVHNVVPGNNEVRIRGFIGWETDINARLHFLVG
jgi:hypothetical protein